ncbi:MAG TPA: hypothetical protein DC063_00125 [Arenimonas sp.]|nr:hypothetical protein [Arenimonas sp.]
MKGSSAYPTSATASGSQARPAASRRWNRKCIGRIPATATRLASTAFSLPSGEKNSGTNTNTR